MRLQQAVGQIISAAGRAAGWTGNGLCHFHGFAIKPSEEPRKWAFNGASGPGTGFVGI